jgi:hypothetical protein
MAISPNGCAMLALPRPKSQKLQTWVLRRKSGLQPALIQRRLG